MVMLAHKRSEYLIQFGTIDAGPELTKRPVDAGHKLSSWRYKGTRISKLISLCRKEFLRGAQQEAGNFSRVYPPREVISLLKGHKLGDSGVLVCFANGHAPQTVNMASERPFFLLTMGRSPMPPLYRCITKDSKFTAKTTVDGQRKLRFLEPEACVICEWNPMRFARAIKDALSRDVKTSPVQG